ncbi:PX domain containing protein [Nitzschia inconspicua]|uniref:PX domain containing protein n=1 Tax=Nitzschia inconspicua TaxID=303405 RepID=A0A9K3LQ80_9STRA|nr:PX domain containing protein [Nitzschia inconspicua]
MVERVQYALATNVSKPENKGTGRAKVTDYLITTSFQKGQSLVRRTFEDFEWVQGQLVEERMGIIVPVLPIKKPTNNKDKFSEEFINERQEGLDRFLQRIIHHSELVDAPCLLPFFTANPADWETAKANAKKNEVVDEDDDEDPNSIKIDAHAAMHTPSQEKKRGPLGKWFAAKRDQWALQKKNLILEETPAEAKKFGDLHTYADHLEVCTRILSEDYDQMLGSYSSMAEKYQTMGAAFTQMWGEHELSTTSSSQLYQTLGQTWAKISKRIEGRMASGKRHFATPVDDLIMDVMALKAALTKRKTALYNYTKQLQEGRNLQEQMDKIRQSADFTGQQDKYYQLEKDIRRSDLKLEEMRKQCEMVTSRLTRDIDRFRMEWHERMRQILEDFHKQQIEFLQQQSMEFSTALSALSTLDTGRSDLPTGPPVPVAKTEIHMSYSTGGAKPVVGSSIPVDNGVSFPEVAPPPASAPPPPPPLSPDPSKSFDDTKSLDSVVLENSTSEDDDFGAMGGEIKLSEKSGAVMTSL